MQRFKFKSCLSLLVYALLYPVFSVPSAAHAGQQGAALARFEYTEYHMGVDVRIVAYAPDKETAERACAAAFERFADLDTIMSDYRDNSELMRLCVHAGGPPVHISRDLFIVLERSQRLARQSEGAFDITCGPLVRLWRKARKTGQLPAPAEIEAARRHVGWRKLKLDSHACTAQLLAPGMQLDLGAIGKGYADDCAQQVLKKYGVTRALVQAGGDIVVTGAPPGEEGWKIETPNAAGSGSTLLQFSNAAISTSGDLEQSALIGGQHYSHVLDPRTGQPLTDRIQITLVAKDGLTSDGLSTAVSVLGPDKGQALAKLYDGVRVYIHYATEQEEAKPTGAPVLPNLPLVPPNPLRL